MKTVTDKLYLTASPCTWREDGYFYSISTYASDTDIIVEEREIEMTVPEGFDPTQPHIDMLKNAKQKIAAKAQIEMNNIDEQIESLLAIEHQPSE